MTRNGKCANFLYLWRHGVDADPLGEVEKGVMTWWGEYDGKETKHGKHFLEHSAPALGADQESDGGKQKGPRPALVVTPANAKKHSQGSFWVTLDSLFPATRVDEENRKDRFHRLYDGFAELMDKTESWRLTLAEDANNGLEVAIPAFVQEFRLSQTFSAGSGPSVFEENIMICCARRSYF